MKIAVFMGGSSPEREVSLNSGKEIAVALGDAGHDVTPWDVEWRGKQTLFETVDEITRNGTDVVFLALHGDLGENGGIQGVLDTAGIAYTGSGITASAITMDKNLTKKLFVFNEIATAPWIMVDPAGPDEAAVASKLGYPCVVKPADLGSTIGLAVVNTPDALADAVATAARFSDNVMAEQYIPGSELTVPVLGGKPLPVIEVRPSHAIYDYECKYTGGMTQYIIPAAVDRKVIDLVQDIAKRVFTLLGLRDVGRIDFRLDAGGMPLCFEANTLPGMTATSLVPKSAKAAGISFPELVNRIALMAAARKQPR